MGAAKNGEGIHRPFQFNLAFDDVNIESDIKKLCLHITIPYDIIIVAPKPGINESPTFIADLGKS
jgi:hypothetical protein